MSNTSNFPNNPRTSTSLPGALPFSALQSFNNELAKSIDQLREQRETLLRLIHSDDLAQSSLEDEIEKLKLKLSTLERRKAARKEALVEAEKLLGEAEGAYMKVCVRVHFYLPFVTMLIRDDVLLCLKIVSSSQILLEAVKSGTGKVDSAMSRGD
ncbi:hypothetical protein HDU93_000785 [Gonapodya sp. JEL0774]|nr:hypothetical protein HDU93_000785 [Gonapodya sp. JEL0774]